MFNTETYTIHKAYTAPSINTHAQSKAVKQAHIRTSSLLCYNYYKPGPSNEDLSHAKPSQATTQEPKHIKATAGSYELGQRYSTPLSQQRTLNKHKLQASVQKQYPNETSQQEESNATTLTSIGAVYRRQSKKIRSRSHNRSHPTPNQISTNSNDVAQVHSRNWTRHPLLKAESLAQEESKTQNDIAF
ncbi:nucleotide-sugar epimerase (ISS) [Dorcoceras hygrometricum]|uniref:Nucleotide-sugar epimerase (ISS) n=1 Tax=Dorcoceras hygrometricum TaxID=472368 RepID=A0A2Z7A9V9_9LAMI|nr:nucleotide-sugar epimerase (ISS) [Dorcoceras hygrometricum]